ncbi:MAG: hypothetical protein KGM99_16215 [Burkholderiales bacterium]|nr:hypothetical protein [Burkholderiales bacterium]
MWKKSSPPVHQIEIRLSKLAELFNSMDPTPFHHRDLDIDAQEYLESWAMGFSQDSHFRIIVYIEQSTADDPAALVTEAIHNYFEFRATSTRRQLRLMMLEGRTSLIIGLLFLVICLLAADAIPEHATSTLFRVLKTSLGIGGWVAMWRPMQTFLYDWWPLARKVRIFINLSRANIKVFTGKKSP